MVSLCHSICIEDLSRTSLSPYDTSTSKIRQMVIKLYDEMPAVLMTQNDIDYFGKKTSKQKLGSLFI